MVAANGAVVEGDVIKNHICISSEPKVHAKFAQRFIYTGFNQLYFHFAGSDQYEFIEGYGHNVLSLIRERIHPMAAATV